MAGRGKLEHKFTIYSYINKEADWLAAQNGYLTPHIYAEQCGIPFVELDGQSVARLGDVDESGSVDVADAVLLARYLAAHPLRSSVRRGMRCADCDQNETIDSDDVLLILRHIAQLITLPSL